MISDRRKNQEIWEKDVMNSSYFVGFDLLEQFDSEGTLINRERLTKTCQCILFKHFVGCIMTALIKCCRVAGSQPSMKVV